MGDISPHFSTYEFKCHHCGRVKIPGQRFLGKLEALRNRTGRPLSIVSGYRCPAWNRAVGGARRSWHLLGGAVDVHLGAYTVEEAVDAGFRGIGVRGGLVCHLDDRAAPRPVIFDDPSRVM